MPPSDSQMQILLRYLVCASARLQFDHFLSCLVRARAGLLFREEDSQFSQGISGTLLMLEGASRNIVNQGVRTSYGMRLAAHDKSLIIVLIE